LEGKNSAKATANVMLIHGYKPVVQRLQPLWGCAQSVEEKYRNQRCALDYSNFEIFKLYKRYMPAYTGSIVRLFIPVSLEVKNKTIK